MWSYTGEVVEGCGRVFDDVGNVARGDVRESIVGVVVCSERFVAWRVHSTVG